MAKANKKKEGKTNKYEEKVGVKGDFLEVFKVVKQNKEQKEKKKP